MATERRELMAGRHNVLAVVPNDTSGKPEVDLVRIGGIDTRYHAVFIDMSREQAERVHHQLTEILEG